MLLCEFIENKLLLEGGAALKGVVSISQEEARKAIPGLLKKIANELVIDVSKVRCIGSAGRKPEGLSGDIDIAAEVSSREVDAVLKRLSVNGNCRAMPGINVYSFAYTVNKKLVQVDLIPVEDIEFATWSYMAPESDLKIGLKGAHRNELFFATAKYADTKRIDADQDGEIDEIERYFYDLSQGLMWGKQDRKNKSGKLSKGFKTVSKTKVTCDPAEICKILFGQAVLPSMVCTFDGTLKAIKAPGFAHAKSRDEILKMAVKGIAGKGLKIPADLD